MGEYDLATLIEMPSDEAATKALLNIGAAGNIRTTTMKAFTEAEYRAIIASL